MFKKIILSVIILLLFAQLEFYGSAASPAIREKEQKDKEWWDNKNDLVNCDKTGEKSYPKLWILWAFVDNVQIQWLGKSKIWEHGEAYYGVSNGIGFFPSSLNFGLVKVGLGDVHINIVNLVLDWFKFLVFSKANGDNKNLFEFLVFAIKADLLCGIHMISVKLLKGIKIKLISFPFMILLVLSLPGGRIELPDFVGKCNEDKNAWYIKFDHIHKISWWYLLWSPRMEINIPELVKLL